MSTFEWLYVVYILGVFAFILAAPIWETVQQKRKGREVDIDDLWDEDLFGFSIFWPVVIVFFIFIFIGNFLKWFLSKIVDKASDSIIHLLDNLPKIKVKVGDK